MKTFDLYGFSCDGNLEQARREFEDYLGLKMEKHESCYHCGEYYRLGSDGDEHFILQSNYDSFDQEWSEPDFQAYSLILYVNATKRAGKIERALTKMEKIKLLRREVL